MLLVYTSHESVKSDLYVNLSINNTCVLLVYISHEDEVRPGYQPRGEPYLCVLRIGERVEVRCGAKSHRRYTARVGTHYTWLASSVPPAGVWGDGGSVLLAPSVRRSERRLSVPPSPRDSSDRSRST